ncbi:MAG: penicillin-insensitive murein endopeptidase [Acidobacteriota bacterium]
MVTPLEVFAGLWLLLSPAWGGPLLASPPAEYASALSLAGSSGESSAPLLGLSDQELRERVESDAASLGSLSIGTPGSAVLFNGVVLPDDPRWTSFSGSQLWATSETIAAIDTAIGTVHELFPDTAALVIGDISDEDGGRLKRHESHQGGRDVDLGFYHKGGVQPTFVAGTAANLDLPRNWALVRALVTRTDVEQIFLDNRVQRLLYRHALAIGEDKAWLDRVFMFSRGYREAIIQHVPRHRNHYHVRFYSPVAQELGRRAHPILVELGVMEPPVFTVKHLVRPGQTLGHLAARYGTSVRSIMRENGLRTTTIRAGRSYRIPLKAAAPPPEPLVLPQRVLPPSTPEVLAAVDWPTVGSLYGGLPPGS